MCFNNFKSIVMKSMLLIVLSMCAINCICACISVSCLTYVNYLLCWGIKVGVFCTFFG